MPVSQYLARFDVLRLIANLYQKIPLIWRQAFFITLGINCLVFASTLVNPPLGNHDLPRLPWVETENQLGYGRWFAPVVFLFAGFAQVPVLNHLTAITFSVAAAIAAISFWKKGDRVSHVVILASLVTLAPAVLFHYYYRWASPLYPVAALLGIYGMILANRIAIRPLLIASVLIMLSIATYQVTVNVLATVFCAYVLFELIETPLNSNALLSLLKEKVLPRVIALASGAMAYASTLIVLKAVGVIGSPYQLDLVSQTSLWSRIWTVLTRPLFHLVQSQAFLPSLTKTALVAVIVTSAALIAYRAATAKGSTSTKMLKALCCVALLYITFVATKASFFVSSAGGLYALKWGFGQAFFYMACAAIILSYGSPAIRNLGTLVLLLVIFMFSREALVFQELMTRSNQHDLAFGNRVLARIESLPGLNVNKRYTYLQLGDFPDFRRQRYVMNGHDYKLEPGNQFFRTLSFRQNPTNLLHLLGTELDLKQASPEESDFRQSARTALRQTRNRKPWPHRSSVFVIDDLIVVYLEEAGRSRLQKEVRQQEGKTTTDNVQ